MKRLFGASMVTIALLGVTAMAQEWTGYISDSHCGAGHMDGSAKSVECIKTCIKNGSAPVFVTMDKKVLKITDAAKVNNFLGQKVTVSGKLAGENLTIASIKAAK